MGRARESSRKTVLGPLLYWAEMTPMRIGKPDPGAIRVWIPALAAWLGACAGGSPADLDKMYVPDDMPEICQDLDFRFDEQYRKVCGVQSHNYRAYRNIPEHRDLLEPKAAVIIQKGEELQLRLENFLPVDLPEDFRGKLRFGEQIRRETVKSKMDYFEFFPPQADRPERLIRLEIPLDNGEVKSVCYTVERKLETQQRKTGTASKLLPLGCDDFTRLKAAAAQKSGPAGARF